MHLSMAKMRTDKEIERAINKARLADERIAWAKEEIDLNNKLIEQSSKRIQMLGKQIAKGKRDIRGKQRLIKIMKDFDAELDKEFESIYGVNHNAH